MPDTPDTFVEYLILILIGLLFAKEYLLAPILKKMGLSNGANGASGQYQTQIDVLQEHARTANEEMSEIREDISAIRADIAWVKGKLDT